MNNQCIAAVSTAFGKGGIAVIRISGEGAIEVAGKMFKPASKKELTEVGGGRAVYGKIYSEGKMIDDGIATVMLTGDGEAAAKAVAEEVDIDSYYAKLMPHEKLDHLQKIRSQKGAVMFVGDGINDTPVLAGADVGAAMGTGADAAIEAADVVFMTSQVAAVPEALQIARDTRHIAWQNVIFALAVKLAVMVLGLLGFASMWLAVFADSGVAMLCGLNSIRMLYKK